ncbi:MAG TPA: DNA replication/repair protein RecF [Firmicutes bacterium]|nr:DNA replication/repair protein RecF [Bacillota bacterium]
MLVRRIFLSNFRNYHRLDIHVGPGLNILLGDNAQGKTNLIEAIHIVATGRSHRSARDSELVSWGRQGYLVKAKVTRGEADSIVEVEYSPVRGKEIRVNGPARPLAGSGGMGAVVVFSPDDLQIVKGGPSLRRRFLDLLIAQVSQGYRYDLGRYVRVLSQRNAVLRSSRFSRSALADLDIWDEQLAEAGARVVKRRRSVIEKLAEVAAAVHPRIGGTGKLDIRYLPSLSFVESFSDGARLDSLKDEFARNLKKVRSEEIERGVSLVGPHRDDVAFLIEGMDARTYASQGQQRSIVLCLKFSELEFIRSETGDAPILLLDDVMSEIDRSHQELLLSYISQDLQAFLTATHLGQVDLGHLDSNRGSRIIFTVENGTCKPMSAGA